VVVLNERTPSGSEVFAWFNSFPAHFYEDRT